jgi:hypothetical protein
LVTGSNRLKSPGTSWKLGVRGSTFHRIASPDSAATLVACIRLHATGAGVQAAKIERESFAHERGTADPRMGRED